MSFAYDSDLGPMEDELALEMEGDFGGFDEDDFLTLGIDPSQPTDAKPGSEDKVMMLAARYSVGLPLWHNDDRYDHGSGQIDVSLFAMGQNQAPGGDGDKAIRG